MIIFVVLFFEITLHVLRFWYPWQQVMRSINRHKKMDLHTLSVFTNGCVATAVRPPKLTKTRINSTLSFCNPGVDIKCTKASEVEQLLQSNIELCQEVQRCREDLQSTIAAMQKLHATRTILCTPVCNRKAADSTRQPATLPIPERKACTTFAAAEQVDEGSSAAHREIGMACDSNDPFASPGMELIERMWDDFSVDRYTTELQSERWRPSVTIPQPFSMSLREEQKLRKKSRSMITAEKEKAEIAAQLEAEIKKQFRATPVPANTFLPLYTLMHAKVPKGGQSLKETNRVMSLRNKGISEHGKRLMFKARPIPKAVCDAEATEKIKCEEEYRKIRIKVRARSVLANSRLPFTTRSRSRQHSAPPEVHLGAKKAT